MSTFHIRDRFRTGHLRVLTAGLTAVALSGVLAGCGASDASSTGSQIDPQSSSSATSPSGSSDGINATKDPAIAAQVPAALAQKGTLIVAVDAEYAPDEFIAEDGKTIVGMDADLAHALGQVLGLKFELQNVSADAIIPGIKSGKYQLSLSSWNDTPERQQQVDFATYYKAGTSFFVKSDSGNTDLDTLAALCGHTVGVEQSSSQLADVTVQNTKCKAQGKQAISIKAFPNQNEANLALGSGRVEVGMADSPVAAYQVQQTHGKFKVIGDAYGTAQYGVIMQKNNGMAKPVLAAVKKLMSSGVYMRILQKWGLQAGAISDPAINIA